MADIPNDPGAASPGTRDPEGAAGGVQADRAASAPALLSGDGVGPIPVLAETVSVTKRRRLTGAVRVSTRTETVQAVAEAELGRYRVEVTRVPVERVVSEAPAARAEGDTTIIPVVEERLVVVKQLVLVEELHVRHILDRETVTEPVTLRRQHAVVQRLDHRNAEAAARPSWDPPADA